MDTVCHLLTFLCICILYSCPHLDSSIVCWRWIQILLSRGQNRLVSNKLLPVLGMKTAIINRTYQVVLHGPLITGSIAASSD